METKEFKVIVPDGMEIDKENSTFECIKFKPIKPKRWRGDINAKLAGYYITAYSEIHQTDLLPKDCANYNLFATEKQAKSALAMAQISQIMENDKRFGGVVTDEEWNNVTTFKYCIERASDNIVIHCYYEYYTFLAFHTRRQCDLFLEENEDLVKDYLMLE